MDVVERALGLHEYVGALEEERRKIQVFQRELPLCLQLVTQAIESVKQKMGMEEDVVSERPVLEEFLPLRPSCSSSEEDEGPRAHIGEERAEKIPDWLRSVQLWNKDPDPLQGSDPPGNPVEVAARKGGGAFQPFDREKRATPQALALAATSSSAETTTTGEGGNKCGYEEKEGPSQPHRKARRCWSPELHRRFIHALEHLGGSHAATPKQIRELMKVDGLTNDEVKSHLQKYRLHTRRLGPVAQNRSSSSPQAPQFVVVGGIWVPPPEYAAAAVPPTEYAAAAVPPTEGPAAPLNGIYVPPTEGPAASLNGIYVPVAPVPSKLNLKNEEAQRSPTWPLYTEGRGNREDEDDVDNSASPTTSSSSSHTTTASPPV